MNCTRAIQDKLAELEPLYTAIHEARVRLEQLQTVKAAQADYESRIAAETVVQVCLRKQKTELEIECQRLAWLQRLRAGLELERTSPADSWPPPWSEAGLDFVRRAESARPEEVEAKRASRRQWKKLINRYSHLLSLKSAVLGRINEITDDPDRPLGEALALLTWTWFVDRTSICESDEDYLARLTAWGAALGDYHDQLAADIDIIETQFQHCLGIWELWRKREQSAEDCGRWEAFIQHKRRALQEENARLEQDVAGLRKHLREAEGL